MIWYITTLGHHTVLYPSIKLLHFSACFLFSQLSAMMPFINNRTYRSLLCLTLFLHFLYYSCICISLCVQLSMFAGNAPRMFLLCNSDEPKALSAKETSTLKHEHEPIDR